ncbi:hypothetical protein BC941DRAFT_509612 [Chlamydoabsidia padenii]|nr:hypothetical protein BC941DRAFT_509612 [Chlamydoabsidia padenii]
MPLSHFFIGKHRKVDFEINLNIQDITNVPLVSGSYFVKWRLRNATQSNGVTTKEHIKDHTVEWYSSITTCAELVINKHHVLQPCELKLEIYQELGGGGTKQMGTLSVNLSEYAQSGLITRRYLLEECKFNSFIKLSIRMEQLSKVDEPFTVPPMTKPQRNMDISIMITNTVTEKTDDGSTVHSLPGSTSDRSMQHHQSKSVPRSQSTLSLSQYCRNNPSFLHHDEPSPSDLVEQLFTSTTDRETSSYTIPYYNDPPSYQHFLQHHLIPNIPAIIGPRLVDHWEARQTWIQPLEPSPQSKDTPSPQPQAQPNYEYLRQVFGAAQVQVADCDQRDFTDQKRSSLTFDAFVDLWQQPQQHRYYLKDWHFVQAFPDKNMYQVPYLFADDWMNEYWQKETEDDYRFTYMGGDGTFTPFHADVYRSYSWSSNICGVKKWTLFPPGQEDLYKDKLGNLVYDIRHVDPKVFPTFDLAKRIVIYQKDGETVFVPSGWFHQVENIGGTISINHNWLNACNIEQCYQSMINDLKDVEHSIDDLKDGMEPLEFVSTCQQLLLAHSGWNWKTLDSLLTCISTRLEETRGTPSALQPSIRWQLDKIHSIRQKLESEFLYHQYMT